MKRIDSPDALEKVRQAILAARTAKHSINICAGTGCHASGCNQVVEAFQTALAENNLASSLTTAQRRNAQVREKERK
jgi:NADH-quinone oxidoreductase subunit F